MNIKPINDKVCIKKIALTDMKTDSGLYIPDIASEELPIAQASVVSIGPKVTQVSVGDTICYLKYSGMEAGDSHIILKEEEILGIMQ